MSTDEYVPSNEDMIHWFEGEENPEIARDLWNTWLAAHDARVRRDAAREALDGYADALNGNRHAAVWGWHDFVRDVREWASSSYPEVSP